MRSTKCGYIVKRYMTKDLNEARCKGIFYARTLNGMYCIIFSTPWNER